MKVAKFSYYLLIAILIIPACSKKTDVVISLVPVFNKHNITCGIPIITENQSQFTLYDLRLFVHDVKIIGSDGNTYTLELHNTKNQVANLALIDFENGCHNGSQNINSVLIGHTSAPEPYKAIEMKVGVPFKLNHANPLNAKGPLTTTSMHWSWQGGYKFMRFDGQYQGQDFHFHLGSTACEAQGVEVEFCKYPNIGHLKFNVKDNSAIVDVASFVSDTLLSKGCMSHEKADCAQFYQALNIER